MTARLYMVLIIARSFMAGLWWCFDRLEGSTVWVSLPLFSWMFLPLFDSARRRKESAVIVQLVQTYFIQKKSIGCGIMRNISLSRGTHTYSHILLLYNKSYSRWTNQVMSIASGACFIKQKFIQLAQVVPSLKQPDRAKRHFISRWWDFTWCLL